MLRDHKRYVLFNKGVNLYKNQEYDQAAKYFIASLTEQVDVNHEFEVSNNKQNVSTANYANAQKDFNKSKKQKVYNGSSFQSLMNLSCCLIKQKEYNKAEKVCYRALEINAYHSLPYYNLASVYIRKQDYFLALNNIKCAISCQYLRKYEKNYDKKWLDSAIDLVENNLQAIKYRIALNSNMLRLLDCMKDHIETSTDIFLIENITLKNTNKSKEILQELKNDIQTIKKYRRVYQVQFHHNRQTNNNFYISTIKPQFILQSKNHNKNERNTKQMKIQAKLQLLKQLKSLRQEYLKILKQNQSDINIEDILNMQLSQKYSYLMQVYQTKLQNIKQSSNLLYVGSQQNTIETSFQLQHSYQSLDQDYSCADNHINSSISSSQQICALKNHNNNRQNIIYPQNNTKINTQKGKNQHHKVNKYNQKNKPIQLKQQRYLANSVISIQDYQDNPTNQHQNSIENLQNQENQYNANLIQSVIVPNSDHNQSVQLFQIQQNKKSYDFLQFRNKSCENLINPLLSPVNNLNKSYFQSNSRLTQCKSYMKLLGCSKCSIDHENEEHGEKNVNLQINLTQIYNYDCNFSELQTFCVIKHNGQEIRTQISKGKFPNWKQPIQFHIDFMSLNHLQSSHCKSNHEIQQSTKIKIQLWAKPTHFKKDSFPHPNDLIELIGQQQIDLREQKWVKKKIILENKLQSNQKKKTAYMYINLQKIKSKKL